MLRSTSVTAAAAGKYSLLLDRVHEHIKLHPLIRQAIDTPQFQRLRNLRQLGASSYLYPGANHTRFEHSIGVSHLAGQWLATLEERSGGALNVTEEERIEVQLAALTHDVGHGPFSHLFEDVILPRLGVEFKHEEMSKMLARQIVVDELKLGADSATRINNMISGTNEEEQASAPYRKQRAFLGQLVSNKCIDSDKLDYYLRDSKSAFGRDVGEVRPLRLFSGTAVDQENCIVFEQKMAITLRELTSLRARLHRSVYQHPTTLRVGNMIGDVVATACEDDAALATFITASCSDPNAFLRLSDWIFDAIRCGAYPKAARAQALCARLDRRQLYPMLGVVQLGSDERFSATREELLRDALSRSVAKALGESKASLDSIRASLIFDRVTIHHGAGAKDPLTQVKFFSPKSGQRPSTAASLLQHQSAAADVMTPAIFQEREIVAMTRFMPGSEVALELKRRFADVSRDVGLSQPSLPSVN